MKSSADWKSKNEVKSPIELADAEDHVLYFMKNSGGPPQEEG